MPGQNITTANNGQIWNDDAHPWQWQGGGPPYKDPDMSWNDAVLPWKAGAPGSAGGGAGEGLFFDNEANSQYVAVLDEF